MDSAYKAEGSSAPVRHGEQMEAMRYFQTPLCYLNYAYNPMVGRII